MSRSSVTWNSFNAGELSPLIDGRTDQDKYFSGCKTLLNFIPTVQGPVSRRGGSRYIGVARNGALEPTWFQPFEFSTQQSYILAFTGGALRFWVNRGQLLNGAVPYEIATPYITSDLVTEDGSFALRTTQSADEMWIVHAEGKYAPLVLQRLGATNWNLVPVGLLNGPFQDIDPDNTVTVTASGLTGNITLTASSPVFTSADINTSFYLEQKDGAGIPTWQVQTSAPGGTKRKYGGNYYLAVNTYGTGKTGANPPVHTIGTVIDGPAGATTSSPDGDGVGWQYRHSGYGWVRILGVSQDGLTATGYVVLSNGILQLPEGVTAGTTRWAHALFNASDGWPTDVGFYRERLFYTRGRVRAYSVVGAYDDFSTKDGIDVTEETAIVQKLAFDGGGSIRWSVGLQAALLSGTDNRELAVSEQTDQKVFAADNVKNDPQTKYGSRLIEPLAVGNAVLFVTRSGRKLREMTFDAQTYSSFKADDLTVLSDHILDAGVIDMDFQQEPDNIVWCVMGDGTLSALTYNRERGVIAWVPHVLAGPDAFVESVGCIPASDGRRDDVWLSVRRTINGQMVRYVEIIEDNTLAAGDTADAFYGDAGITYSGAATKIVAGLDHLAGAKVQVLADGSAHADCVVTQNGTAWQITLNRAASKVQIGFDPPAQLQTMRVASSGPGQGQTLAKSIAEVWVRMQDTIGGLVGPSLDRLDPIPGLRPNLPVGTRPALYSGDRKMEMPAQYDTDGYICVQSSPMLPITVVMLAARVEIDD